MCEEGAAQGTIAANLPLRPSPLRVQVWNNEGAVVLSDVHHGLTKQHEFELADLALARSTTGGSPLTASHDAACVLDRPRRGERHGHVGVQAAVSATNAAKMLRDWERGL